MPVVQINPQDIALADIIGIDIETTGLLPWVDTIELIAINTGETTYILEAKKYGSDFIRNLFRSMEQCTTIIAHNAKFECSFIYSNYGVLLKNWWCTQLASQILVNGKDGYLGKHSLPDVITRYLNIQLEFDANKKLLQKSFTKEYNIGSFTEKQFRYVAGDVDHLIALYNVQLSDVADLELGQITKLENTLLPILSKMEVEGVLIDKESWLNVIKTKWEPKLHEIEARLDTEVRQLTGGTITRNKQRVISFDLFGYHSEQIISNSQAINYSSQSQVLDFFQDVEGRVPLTEGRSPGEVKPSVDDLTLTKYLNENPDTRLRTFIGILKEYREQDKLLSTYGEAFLDLLDNENNIHTQYTQTFTKTGRLSSKNPNLQNIPSPTEEKPDNDVRKFFIAKPGYKLITCDMASAEVAIAADYSGETLLLDSLLNGMDMHSELSSLSYSIIFGKPIQVSQSKDPISIGDRQYIPKELRTAHKSVVFAKFYKAGAKRIYSTLAEYINPFHQTKEERLEIASRVSRSIDERMPQLSSYLNDIIKKAQKDGYLRTSKLGRIRFFNSDVYGEAANAPIQGTNAEAIKIAMIKCFRKFEEMNWDARVAMNVHDELVIEAHASIAEEVADAAVQIMADALSYFLTKIKGNASKEIGNHWKK
jgi:DNA polymerase-1